MELRHNDAIILMMKRQFTLFLVRWVINSLALWIAVRILSTGDFASTSAGIATFLFAGFVFSIVNALLRPLIIILALPAILLTLGLFMLVVNGVIVYIALKLTPSIHMPFFPGAILTGIVVSLTNYVLSGIIERYKRPKEYIDAH